MQTAIVGVEMEGVAVPRVDGVNEDDGIVPIDEDGGLALHLRALSHDDGVDVGQVLFGVKAQGGKLANQEVSAVIDISGMLGLGRYAGDAQKGK